ncbi:blastula protease 10-like [Ochlerotatus camptorhynchus]|uniref:blastula protease 10-like n=1 Tax=Ochlerotatus camptorhynchus TaxID=644619 RepID=UPI0031E1E3A6
MTELRESTMSRLALVLVSVLVAVGSTQAAAVNRRLRQNTPENIKRLRSLQPDDLKEEFSGQFEGDIVLTEEQENAIFSLSRNGRVNLAYRWPNKVIPFVITEDHFTPEQVAHIHRGLRLIETQTCLTFKPLTDERDYIRVIGNEKSGCWSYVGFLGIGEQQLHLDPSAVDTGCFRIGTIVHEFIHALGFYHMQSATDRDDFVEILYENIQDGKENNFAAYDESSVTSFNVRYDYGSVMHYSGLSFSKNGLPTIVPKDPNAVIGQRAGMSERDISKLNLMYQCLKKD